MGRIGRIRALAAAFLLAAFIAGGLACSKEPEGEKAKGGPSPRLTFNEHFIEGHRSPLRLEGAEAVFKTVFSALESEVVVYPTENHYYFIIEVGGKTIWGNLRLDASDRDEGIVHLGYFEYDENGLYPVKERGGKVFSSKDGVTVRRKEPLAYSVSYQGKTVVFRLHDSGRERPQKARLLKSERFVGPIFDESGLQFFLLYNASEKHFMYVLNEEGYVPEEFSAVGEDVLIGKRTGLSFFHDKKNDRKILIGVHAGSVSRNNWYDGPADQLPDNYAEGTNIASYIQEAYPATKGAIDKFGNYKERKGYRVLIVPYTIYHEEGELARLVEACKALGLAEGRFHTCLTPDPYQ